MTTALDPTGPDGAPGSPAPQGTDGAPIVPPPAPTATATATATTTAAPTASRPTAPSLAAQLALTLLHLAALGVVGLFALSTLFSVAAAGVGTLPVLGFGLILLVGCVYAAYGMAWFETERVAGLYGLATPRLRLRPQLRPGFGGWLRAIGRQSIDGRMWRGIASLTIASFLGVAVVALLQGAISGILLAALGTERSGLELFGIGADSVAVGVVGALLAVAAIVGIVLLARVIAIAIIGARIREEQLEEQVAQTTRQRAGAVRAADLERTRIERDLHDGVQPRLVSIAMTLGIAQQRIDEDPEQAKALVAEAHTSTKAAITELRQLARGIHASVLDDRGLDAALSALAARSHVPVALDVRLSGRASHEAETAVYFAIAESLTNAAKHSRASEVRVVVRERDGALWARVEDNGIGGATILPGGGLDGIMNRIIAAGGTASLDSPRGGPTALEVSVPCAS